HPRAPLFPYTTLFRSPSEGFPPRASDEPVKRCAPAPRRALNWTNPSLALVTFTVNVYVHTSAPAGLDRVGPDVIVTLEEGVNPRSEEHTSELQSLAYL